MDTQSHINQLQKAQNALPRYVARQALSPDAVLWLYRILTALSLLGTGISFFGIIALVAAFQASAVTASGTVFGIIGLAILEIISLRFLKRHVRH